MFDAVLYSALAAPENSWVGIRETPTSQCPHRSIYIFMIYFKHTQPPIRKHLPGPDSKPVWTAWRSPQPEGLRHGHLALLQLRTMGMHGIPASPGKLLIGLAIRFRWPYIVLFEVGRWQDTHTSTVPYNVFSRVLNAQGWSSIISALHQPFLATATGHNQNLGSRECALVCYVFKIFPLGCEWLFQVYTLFSAFVVLELRFYRHA